MTDLTPEQINSANFFARQNILRQAILTCNQASAATLVTNAGDIVQPVQSVNLPCTGLVVGFWVIVTATITNGDSTNALTLTPFGASNLLQRVAYYDPTNMIRTNASGRNLDFWNSQRQGQVFGGNTSPNANHGVSYQSWNANYAPSTIAASGSATIQHMYYLPLAMSERSDLTGAVWAQLQNASQRMDLTFANKSQMVVGTGADAMQAVYQSAGSTPNVTISNVNYKVYMSAYTQGLPTNKNGDYVVPTLDLSKVYALQDSTVTGLVAGQDKSVDYPAAWTYLSTTVTFNNGGQLNAGTDVTELFIKSVGGIELQRIPPSLHATTTALRIGCAPPAGMYYDAHHAHPISTSEYGSISWGLKPSTVNANAYLSVAYEFIENRQRFGSTGLSLV